MATLGLLDRNRRSDGLIGNYCRGKEAASLRTSPSAPIVNDIVLSEDQLKTGSMDVTTDWYWEGNVVDALERYLSGNGWEIINKANTHSKEQGVDLHATKAGTMLLIEAKGYPSKQYRDPRRVGEHKPTNPTNQAQQWYSHALLKAMRLQTTHMDAVVALAFPDFPRYRILHQETRTGLEKLGVALLLVKENGDVQTWGI